MITLKDSEMTVIIDSMAMARQFIQDVGRDTPNIDNAVAKINSEITPRTSEFVLMTREQLSSLLWAGECVRAHAAGTAPLCTPPYGRNRVQAYERTVAPLLTVLGLESANDCFDECV